MGNSQTRFNLNDALNVFQSLKLPSDEIRKIFYEYSLLDTDGDGKITMAEFGNIPSIIENPLISRLTDVMDINKDGGISFIEFLVTLCKLSVDTDDYYKIKFVFDLYDVNGDGYISNGELFTLLRLMVGTNLNDIQLQQLVDRTIIKHDKDKDGMISFEEFQQAIINLEVPSRISIAL